MIIDFLDKAARYEGLGERFRIAFSWLQQHDLEKLAKGKHLIDGENIFALVNEYETVDAAAEKMEAHKAHIDLQYMVSGTEMVGHGFLRGQQPLQAYDATADFMLFSEAPDFFTRFDKGMFAIFFPEDLHMPNLKVGDPGPVRKVVVKIRVH